MNALHYYIHNYSVLFSNFVISLIKLLFWEIEKYVSIRCIHKEYLQNVYYVYVNTFVTYNHLIYNITIISRPMSTICMRLKFIDRSRVFVNPCWSWNNDIGRRTEAARTLSDHYCDVLSAADILAFVSCRIRCTSRCTTTAADACNSRRDYSPIVLTCRYLTIRNNIRSRLIDRRYSISRFALQ